MASTLQPPPKKALKAFHVGQVGADTVGTYLQRGWSLAICCKSCERLVEWTPPELMRRFAEPGATPIAAIATRLSCAGPEGCGAREIAVFPHAYDGAWSWPAPGAARDTPGSPPET